MILLGVVFLGAFWWFPVALTSNVMHPALRIAAGIIGALALVAALDRDVYLPFLAETVIPPSVLAVTQRADKSKPSPEDVITVINGLPPKTLVVYWAAENGDPRTRDLNIPSAKDAYGNYTNSGVVESDITGKAQVLLKCPQKYNVSRFGITKTLDSHLHYRYMIPGKKGLLSKVSTHYFKCQLGK
jgi:hypothetical protein